MAVRIRMKKMGRRHRPFFRICATDSRSARDGRVIEELGYYDPMVPDADARAVLNGERIDYWLSVGAAPSDKVKVLIKKYGTNGTRRQEQQAALERLRAKTRRPEPLAPQQEEASEADQSQEAAPPSDESAETAPNPPETSPDDSSE